MLEADTPCCIRLGLRLFPKDKCPLVSSFVAPKV